MRNLIWTSVLGAVGAFGAGVVIYILASLVQPHVLDFELSGLAGLLMVTVGGIFIGALGGVVAKSLDTVVGWIGSVAIGAALGMVSMGVFWCFSCLPITYLPSGTKTWVAIMMIAAGAVSGALGALASPDTSG